MGSDPHCPLPTHWWGERAAGSGVLLHLSPATLHTPPKPKNRCKGAGTPFLIYIWYNRYVWTVPLLFLVLEFSRGSLTSPLSPSHRAFSPESGSDGK